MPFNQFAQSLKKSENEKTIFDYYMAVQNLKRAFPQLVDDYPLPPYVGKLHGGPHLWIGCTGHYEFCHFDPDDGLLSIITGRKKVTLFSYNYLKHLYPNPLGSPGRTVQSQVNCDDPDLERFPLFEEVVREECILEPGEMLFIPAFYWHQVTALESSISINVFFGDAGVCSFVDKVVNSRWEAFSYWVLNVIAQNRMMPSWKDKLLPQLAESLKGFFFSQYHEDLNEELHSKIIDLVLQDCGLSEIPKPQTPKLNKWPPRLKIRGLLFRDKGLDGKPIE
eukprot:TRINITY_DN8887_c0_g1_i1.p1 TRINITY_DN8887_c0_g1~~TRINITY_DN8887_c0_g1_i1.p1  ORF type:complete len:279 (+),score=42.77 TRINITY_DN8887_c0_g1_i1:264-1100(+)